MAAIVKVLSTQIPLFISLNRKTNTRSDFMQQKKAPMKFFIGVFLAISTLVVLQNLIRQKVVFFPKSPGDRYDGD